MAEGGSYHKEGRARLNPALRREETIPFALRRLGCCSGTTGQVEARAIARAGGHEMTMAGQVACRVRLAVFAGHGHAPEAGVLTVPLSRCTEFISERLRSARDVLAGTQFKDPVLGLLALQDKLAQARDNGGGAENGKPLSQWSVQLQRQLSEPSDSMVYHVEKEHAP